MSRLASHLHAQHFQLELTSSFFCLEAVEEAPHQIFLFIMPRLFKEFVIIHHFSVQVPSLASSGCH
jgi:hypothetical protein